MDYVEPKGYFTKEMKQALKGGNKAEKKATKETSKPAPKKPTSKKK